jgi:hypothetical protein
MKKAHGLRNGGGTVSARKLRYFLRGINRVRGFLVVPLKPCGTPRNDWRRSFFAPSEAQNYFFGEVATTVVQPQVFVLTAVATTAVGTTIVSTISVLISTE